VPSNVIRPGSLVLYKVHPAIVRSVGDKIEIELEGGRAKRVRDKDVALLHPGPAASLGTLDAAAPDVEETWELLGGEQATLAELADLLYGEFTPATAWGAWTLVADGLYFEGAPDRVTARSAEQVRETRDERDAREAAARQWANFLSHVEAAALDEDDRKRLSEVERVALGQSAASRILAHFDVPAQPVAAHRFLVRCGYWDDEHNPHPSRIGVSLVSAEPELPALPDEPRRDLTHLPAFAIDDAGNQDPDDAISVDGDRLWVHVADVAALVAPGGGPDLAARERGANLYLPEGVVGMLPDAATLRLGLGLSEESPALSFGFRLGDEGVVDVEVVPSRVRVTRTTYDEVDRRLDEAPFAAMREMTSAFRAQRLARGATELELPEVSIKLVDGEIVIRPLRRLGSRQLVTDAMLMAGEAAARLAQREGVVVPYALQAAPDELRSPSTLSEMYAYRRFFKPSQSSSAPGHHFGLGLPQYSRATSPLRRYLDLVTHQQLRALVTGGTPLGAEAVAERIGASEAVSGLVRRAERLSNQHWKLAWLRRHAGWEGEGIVVALEERKAVVLVPELALETRVRLGDGVALDQSLRLRVREVDLAEQSAFFQVLK
jgi:exoribonuclease-2